MVLEGSNFRDGMLSYRDGDFQKAKKSFDLALSQDHAIQANFMLGKMYLYGEGVLANIQTSIKYLERASQSGNIRADCYLAEAYIKNGTDKKKAISLLKTGIKRNIKECKKIYNMQIKQGAKK